MLYKEQRFRSQNYEAILDLSQNLYTVLTFYDRMQTQFKMLFLPYLVATQTY